MLINHTVSVDVQQHRIEKGTLQSAEQNRTIKKNWAEEAKGKAPKGTLRRKEPSKKNRTINKKTGVQEATGKSPERHSRKKGALGKEQNH